MTVSHDDGPENTTAARKSRRRISLVRTLVTPVFAVTTVLVAAAIFTDNPSTTPRSAAPHVTPTTFTVQPVVLASFPTATPGDPGRKILRTLVGVVQVVPGYGTKRLPLVRTSPLRAVPYLYEHEASPDSCDGRAGTFGWDNPYVEAVVRWNDSPSSLYQLLNSRLRPLGLFSGDPPWASNSGNQNTFGVVAGVRVAVHVSYDGNNLFEIDVEAPPHGRSPSGC